MPWKETCAMQERVLFIEEYVEGGESLAKQFFRILFMLFKNPINSTLS